MAQGGIYLKGDWRKLWRTAKKLNTLCEVIEDEIMPEVIEDFQRAISETVLSNPAPANAPRTVKRKGHQASLVETGEMADESSQKVYRNSFRQSGNVRVSYTIAGAQAHRLNH